jgi:uncharacterized OB-fold protein
MREIEERYRREARDGRLMLQQCTDCRHVQAFPRAFCSRCGGREVAWKQASGRGTVAAITTLHRAPTADYRDKVPYVIALVDLAEGVQVMGHAAPDLAIHDPVSAGFALHGERHLLFFDHADRRSA